MYTVMLLDDEPWELKGMRQVFPWEKYGFRVDFVMESSVAALSALANREVDVLMTDIRMPDLNGIELLKAVREKGIDTEVVFLSGYAEFEYARQALKSGAFDYFLKPVGLDETDPFLKRLRARLDEKAHIKSHLLFDRLMNGEIIPETLFAQPVPAGGQFYHAAALWATEPESDFPDQGKETQSVRFTLAPGKYLYYLKFPAEAGYPEGLIKSGGRAKAGMSLAFPPDRASFSELAGQAEMAYHNDFITGKSEPVLYYETDLKSLKKCVDTCNRLYDERNLVKLKEALREIPACFGEEAVNLGGVSVFWDQVLLHCINDGELLGEYRLLDYQQILEQFSDIRDLCEGLFSILEASISGDVLPAADARGREIYDAMMAFIHSHYQKQISLTDAAAHACTNFTNACRMFKKFGGTTYSRYLTGYRMGKACELLASTDLTIEKIGIDCGYSDYFYFSKAFKKHTSLTPYQYRKTLEKGLK